MKKLIEYLTGKEVIFYYNFAPMIGLGYCKDPGYISPSGSKTSLHFIYLPFIILTYWETEFNLQS